MPSPPRIPVMRPLLPPAQALLPYIEKIDEARWYSNMGPMVTAFEAKLAEHFGVDPTQVVTSANGTLALEQTLQAMQVKAGSYCVMPSWTFVATPAAAHAAGLKPYFVDVDPRTWAIDPTPVLDLMTRGHEVGAVIPVAPFGAPLDLRAWEDFQRKTGVHVLVDAAAGFDSHAGLDTTLPYMVSLHATKVFGIGEGAVMVSPDRELAKEIRRAGNFGFSGSREAHLPGFNAKLSEYSAAIGLAGFERWPETRDQWARLTARFMERLRNAPALRPAPGFADGWVSCYGMIELSPPHNVERVAETLARAGIETRQWWGKGGHTHPAYKRCSRAHLPYTEDLANRVIGLPFWLGLDAAGLDDIFDNLGEMLSSVST